MSDSGERTVEGWALDLITTRVMADKLTPAPRPSSWARAPVSLRVERPGRPPELSLLDRHERSPRRGALVDPRRRAQLVHTFFHHELQAAELMCWALLAFPETPRAFRVGLMRVCDDELRHARMYAAELVRLGSAVGAFGVRDWFWERVPRVESAAQFVAVMGIGFEGANLDHTARFSEWLRAAGDPQAAQVVAQVGREEIAHVRFALRWYARWTGQLDFDRWRHDLPPPISPILLRGKPIDHEARKLAGLEADFVSALERYQPI